MWIDRLPARERELVPLIADGSTPDGQRRALSEAEHHPQVAPLLDQVLSGRKRTEDIDLCRGPPRSEAAGTSYFGGRSNECGAIIEFRNELVEREQEKIAQQRSFRLTKHQHILFGDCTRPDCENRKSQRR